MCAWEPVPQRGRKWAASLADLAHRQEEVSRRCRAVLQARVAELTVNTRANGSGPANVDFTLASV